MLNERCDEIVELRLVQLFFKNSTLPGGQSLNNGTVEMATGVVRGTRKRATCLSVSDK